MVAFNSVLFFAALANALPKTDSYTDKLPIVDLGYERHQAASYNSTGQFYNFSNIRYAAPPTGLARFAAPHPPAKNRKTVQTGGVGKVCPQAYPAWERTAGSFVPAYLSGQPFTPPTSAGASSLPVQDPRTDEDCLFLDVVVPKKLYDAGANASPEGAPVMVWFYGGGYSSGDKTSSGSPSGLIDRSEEEIIYVSFNYRLGAFGFLAGDDFRKEGGVSNAGLLDQRLALKWVKDHIAKFGGDPERVTVFGESAGGSSILHHITAPKPALFSQALLQSPAFQPIVGEKNEDVTYEQFLKLLNVTTLAEARKAPFQSVLVANIKAVGAATYGAFTFGPTVDGAYVPDLPGRRLAEGKFNKDLNIMVGHNADEGLLFTSPTENGTAGIKEALDNALPTLKNHPKVQDHILNVLYPPPSNTTSYHDEIGRAVALISELVVTCNTFYLDKAFHNHTYAYEFAIPPALHAQDVGYTYYTGTGQPQPNAGLFSAGGVLYPEIAIAMQDYFTSFAQTGKPNLHVSKRVPMFRQYGDFANLQLLTPNGISHKQDDADNARCDYWQQALYFPKPN